MAQPQTPPKKKAKRLCNFNDDWLKEEENKEWLRKANNREAKCVLCNCIVNVGTMGKSALKKHRESENHKLKARASTSSQIVTKFFTKSNSVEADNVSCAELAQIFHAIKHNLSYNSLDCAIKLNCKIFSDSKLCQKMSCGRTKAEAIVCEVMGPHALQNVLKILKEHDKLFYAVQIDASNRKNVKLFPICLQFFSQTDGLQNYIIDFVENSDETAEGMFTTIEASLTKLGLSFERISCLSADNTNANFGANNSLFTNIKNKNSSVLKANCHAHIIHNCFKRSAENLDVDIENVVLKIYSHFSVSAKRREELKEFFSFANCEWKEILRHVSTRWLSLQPAIERLLVNWPAISSYFLSLQDCPKQIRILLGITEDSSSVKSTVEIYLLFCSHVLELFKKAVLQLEGSGTTACEVYSVFHNLRQQLLSRKNQEFFGYEVAKRLKNSDTLDKRQCNSVKTDFKDFLTYAISYLEKWFDFSEDSWLKSISCVALHGNSFPSYEDFTNIFEKLSLGSILDINMDQLFEEVVLIRDNWNVIVKSPQFLQLNKPCDKWLFIFKSEIMLPNIFKIISYLFSIPASSAFCERVFSVVNIKWREERNRCSIDLIKNELLIYFNVNKTCSNYFDSIQNEPDLLKAAKSSKKYSFKK